MFCSEPLCEADMKAAKETSEEKKSEARVLRIFCQFRTWALLTGD